MNTGSKVNPDIDKWQQCILHVEIPELYSPHGSTEASLSCSVVVSLIFFQPIYMALFRLGNGFDGHGTMKCMMVLGTESISFPGAGCVVRI